ncbi:MAG: phosphatase PAP2 family protein [Flavobacteriales bacterium]|nr:phosphatase PAP2 family protein [Flavobacteriales bacterium]
MIAFFKTIFCSFFVGFTIFSNAQTPSTHENNNKSPINIILPAAFIVGGVALNGSTLEKKLAIDVRNTVGNDYQFKIDDYIQYLPMVEIYAADAFSVASKNNWKNQTKYLALSQLTTALIVHTIKFGLKKERPDHTANSFPSGHTSQSIVGATVLFHEFKDEKPLLAYSGYIFVATTGAFRIINNRHWLSDVVFGAGVGLLMTNIVYHLEPLKKLSFSNKKNEMSFFPYYNGSETMICYSLRF